VVCLEWLDPPVPAGNWVPEMVEMAGGRVEPAAADHGGSGAWRILSAFKPEVLVVFPCGFSLEQTRRDLPGLFRRPGWDDMPAVHEGRVYLIDGNSYFNRPGPRIVDSLERLAGCLWPSEFPEFARASGVERAR
jgi:iron complex transport system substrate-binding protein